MAPEQSSHRTLFDKYVAELTEAKTASEAWWNELLATEALVATPDESEARVRSRWPFGPASHPYVIDVYRKYYIACLDLTRDLEERHRAEGGSTRVDDESDWGQETGHGGNGAGRVPPSAFLADWLFGDHDDLRLFIADLVFSPMGIEDMRR